MSLKFGTRVGPYTVDAVLGRGGQATVYRVLHREKGSLHALKILRRAGRDVARRLLREGRLQGELTHPGIVAVQDLLAVDGAPGLVLEYVDGLTLGDLFRARRLEADEADVMGRRLIEAVAAAHAHGLVHRDLKPGNILLPAGRGTVQPKIADFGLVKVVAGNQESLSLTATGASMGTPGYLAPEQIRDAGKVDARADLFSMGAVLFELATGRRAFDGIHVTDILQRIVQGNHRPVAELEPTLPLHRVEAIERCLQVDPEARPATAEALLDEWIGASPEPPGRESWYVPVRVAEGGQEDVLGTVNQSHPPLHEVIEGTVSPEIIDHLARCAACRIELRLYHEEFTAAVEGTTVVVDLG
ncbi:MAG: serine/threonine protein kinase [Proteobacteria bacterium]|nr:serine/threonine protein kinase [Pseudomonadota bacterium]